MTLQHVCDVNLKSVLEKVEENSQLAVTLLKKHFIKLMIELH